MTTASSTDAVIAAARYLAHALRHPSPAFALLPLNDNHHAALQNLADIFSTMVQNIETDDLVCSRQCHFREWTRSHQPASLQPDHLQPPIQTTWHPPPTVRSRAMSTNNDDDDARRNKQPTQPQQPNHSLSLALIP
jgi:hypothetical protein